jgi:hypothetical protein
MIQNTLSLLNTQLPARPRAASLNIWQFRSADGEKIWTWITWAFFAYWILFVAGAFLGRKELNEIGGVLILGVLAWIILERLWVRLDAVVVASLAAATFIPLMQLIGSGTIGSLGALVKYVSLCLVMAASRLLRLPAASSSRMRWALATQILVILLISLTIYRGSTWDGGTRHSGLFANPNNLALIPFLLLFLVDRYRDRVAVRIGAHALVVLVLAFTGTSGAVLAYAVALTIHLSASLPRNWRLLTGSLAAISAFIAITLLLLGADRLLPETRLTKQVSVVGAEFQKVVQGEEISYYEQERVLGPGTGSALWRLAHWCRTLRVFDEATAFQKIFGLGSGSSIVLLGKLPHNEYLRLLFEQGIAGFALFMFAWYRLIKNAPATVRYVGLILAIYSFSENNQDNFPFMSLFILCLSANSLTATVRRAALPAWRASVQGAVNFHRSDEPRSCQAFSV